MRDGEIDEGSDAPVRERSQPQAYHPLQNGLVSPPQQGATQAERRRGRHRKHTGTAPPFPPIERLEFRKRFRAATGRKYGILLMQREGNPPILSGQRGYPIDRGRHIKQTARGNPVLNAENERAEAKREQQ